MFSQHTVHVNNVDCVVVRFQVLENLDFGIGSFVHRVDERYKASFFDGVFIVRATDVVELLCVPFSEDFHREGVWVYRISGMSLYSLLRVPF